MEKHKRTKTKVLHTLGEILYISTSTAASQQNEGGTDTDTRERQRLPSTRQGPIDVDLAMGTWLEMVI